MNLFKVLVSFIFFSVIMGTAYTAYAHVTLNPQVSEPGSYEAYHVRVPVERDENTVKLELEVPDGVTLSTVEPVPGFKHSFTQDKKGNIKKVTWTATGKGIGKHEHMDFPIVVANPDEEGTFKWSAIQTYKDGKVVRWTDEDAESETPAPTTEVKENSGNVSSTEAHTESSTGMIALWIISILALIVSAIALFKRGNFTKSDN
ncbi:YcnI family protein [Staphylococcus sp. 17KM0847]|uniref:YcnI family protein n=1 Tax=Staphylococcus sp. 17KM0847 TaxID=2583989 RepID=UPI0015DC8201|nr:YcnI family protein [Staphylococcus sp. 17KM0847]QLK86730.1 YcnI family protein [Staphylococcus sp. 17KM0847]